MQNPLPPKDWKRSAVRILQAVFIGETALLVGWNWSGICMVFIIAIVGVMQSSLPGSKYVGGIGFPMSLLVIVLMIILAGGHFASRRSGYGVGLWWAGTLLHGLLCAATVAAFTEDSLWFTRKVHLGFTVLIGFNILISLAALILNGLTPRLPRPRPS